MLELLGVLIVILICVLMNKVGDYSRKTEKALAQLKSQIEVLVEAQQGVVLHEVQIEKQQPPKADVTEALVPAQAAEKPEVAEESVDQETDESWEKHVRHSMSYGDERAKAAEKNREKRHPASAVRVATKVSTEGSVAQKRKPVNYEKFIGENLFGKIGILIFVIGVGLFVKYAIDQEWINETFRTILGFLTGGALLFTAGVLQKKYRTFSSLLAGGAFAVFYLTVAIAFHYYHLFSQGTAFALLVGITVFMSVLSVLYDRRELAITALVGGFLAPFIISSGEGSYLMLFTYLSVLNVGMFGLSFYKKWRELPVIAFVFTYTIMGIFVLRGYGNVPNVPLVCGHLLAFATLFYFIFLLPILSILRMEARKMSNVLLSAVVSNNFIYLFFGLTFLSDMHLPFRAEGVLTLLIAIVNLSLILSLRKRWMDCGRLLYTMLGLVLTFVSITVPIQLDGNYITLFWASETVILLWLYAKSKVRMYEYATLVLAGLTFVSFLMDMLFNTLSSSERIIFLNGTFATSFYMGLATGAFALLLRRYRKFFSTARLLNYFPWNAIMLIACAVIMYYTFTVEFCFQFEGEVRVSAILLFSSAFVLVACRLFDKRFPMGQHTVPYVLCMGANVGLYVAMMESRVWWELRLAPSLMLWLAAGAVIANLYDVARRYYAFAGFKTLFTVYLNVLSTLLWLAMAQLLLLQLNITEFSAGFSIALSIVGFVQMGLGMRLHQKVLRIISLSTFGIVLLKLILIDLWAMPTIGKIIVFVILGLILLMLSFLYQKLKDVLFKSDEDEVN